MIHKIDDNVLYHSLANNYKSLMISRKNQNNAPIFILAQLHGFYIQMINALRCWP